MTDVYNLSHGNLVLVSGMPILCLAMAFPKTMSQDNDG